ncbi:MAG: hypothetical protein JW820_06415 [Spirochaetales bacterium]|nr:hypothetical protein [Spirochaetales bacterium]
MTLGFRLTLKRLRDGRMCLSVPVFYRALLGGIGLLILLALLFTAPPGEDRGLFVPANTVPLIVALLSLLGALYHERWIFDRPGDAVIHRVGVAFIRSVRRYRISELTGLELEGTHGGRVPAPGLLMGRRGPLLTLWLNGRDRSQHRLETYAPAQGGRAAETARALAEYCSLPLREA